MELVVKKEEQKIRLDKYIAFNTLLSRSLVAKMISADFILVNGQKEKSSYEVKENDLILIKDGYVKDIVLEPMEFNIDIIYEDEYLMVINKPSGLVVHPGSGNKNNTLVNALIYHGKSLSNNDLRPGIVHRLDKDTSGLMLIAKTDKTHELLSEMFKNKEIKREYIALLVGRFPHNEATIDAPIGRDKTNREVMTVKKDNSKKAITHLKVIKKYQNYTLVSLILDTGRTHQIRVHTKYIGYPVYNDPVYNKKTADDFGQFLHSAKISFIHPITQKNIKIEVSLPDVFQSFINELDKLENWQCIKDRKRINYSIYNLSFLI